MHTIVDSNAITETIIIVSQNAELMPIAAILTRVQLIKQLFPFCLFV